ncbi:hypothetical protein [Gemella cuniculi]|uniref:hypothetical protein n=1 Tax=Gemella cuniculi TaxID=150240 RepID=UPI0004266B14|nr:hypothetical protein [Gemella cuniculi]
MKTKKILKSSMSVAFAMTIGAVTAQAWPTTSNGQNIAKADFGDQAASEQTKAELRSIIDKVFNDKNLTNRYLGTSYLHKTSKFPYYHVSFENHSIPDDVIDTTPWYNMWSEAAAAKVKLDANSYTEKTARNAINTLNYYSQLYNFEVGRSLKKDGFYTTSNFTTPTMVRSGGDGHQDFYKKAVGEPKEEIKELFKDKLVGIYKQGQDIEVNLVANSDKISKITSFTVNNISGITPKVNLGPSSQNQTQVAFNVPGELKAEQLVVTNMTYLDKNGNKKETGPFALDIDYSKLVPKPDKDGNGIPNYRKNLEEKIQKWINRGRQVNEWLLTKENTLDTLSDFSQRAKVSEAVTKLEELKRNPDASYDKLYELTPPIHEAENIATLREILDIKVAKFLESFNLYSPDIYTEESIRKFKEYIQSIPKLKNGKNLRELVQLIKEFDNANVTYLKYNTSALERLIKIGDTKIESEYTPLTWEKFSTALRHAKDWIKQNKEYHPQINDTPELVKQLRDSINNLIKTNGDKGEQVPADKSNKKEENSKAYNISGKLVDRGTTNPLSSYGGQLSDLIQNISVVNKGDKNELTITFKVIRNNAGNISKAVTKFDYNKSGVLSTPEILEKEQGNINSTSFTYYKKVKLLVDKDKKDIAVDLEIADEYSLANNKSSFTSDLLLDYNNKSESETKKDPLKEQLKKRLNYIESKQIKENYKNIPDNLKTNLNQLTTKANTLLSKDNLEKDEVEKLTNQLLEESSKLDALSNLYQALQAAKDTYENFWKNNTDYTKESKIDVKSRLDKLEDKIKKLDNSDIEGTKEASTDEHGITKEIIVYKTIDQLTGQLQGLSDYLRIDTTKLEAEVKKAEKKLAEGSNNEEAKLRLQKLIDKIKKYIEHTKLTPDSHGTDDQVNTNLTDYYTEQLNFAIKDLSKVPPKEDKVISKEDLQNKIKEAEAITIGNKTEEAFYALKNEMAEARKIANKDNAGAEEIKKAFEKLSAAIETFNKSKDREDNSQTPPTPKPSPDEKPNEPDNNRPEDNRVKIGAELKKINSDQLSIANSVLKDAYYITENGKSYIELSLQPMYNNNKPVAVLSKLTTFDGNTEVENVEVLSKSNVDITYDGQTKTYEYPTKVRIPVTGKPNTMKVNTYASSTIFGNNAHSNAAILSLSYPNNEDNQNNVDKEELQKLFKATTSKYYESWTRIFESARIPKDMTIVNKFNEKVNVAQSVLKNNNATEKEITTAFNELRSIQLQYDLLIRLRTANAEAEANFKSDKKGNNYSKESLNRVEKYLQEKIDRLEELVHNNPKSSEIEKLFEDVQNYYTLLRYNTSALEDAVKIANDRLKANNLTDAQKEPVKKAIEATNEFIEKAKTTRNITDKRKELLESLNNAVKGLPSANTPNPKNPNTPKKPENPSEKDKALESAKLDLYIPLQAADILIADDSKNPKINQKALNKFKTAVKKAKETYEHSKSIEEIKKAIVELGTALTEYQNNKNNSNDTDKQTPPKDDNQNKPGNNNNDKPIAQQIFEDLKNGVKVEFQTKTPAAKLETTEVKDNNLIKDILDKLELPSTNKVRVLDLKLVDKNNKVVNSNAKRTVAIVLQSDEKDVSVYHIKETGELELINSKVEGNVLKFEINHFSKFAIVSNSKIKKQKTPSEKNPENSNKGKQNSSQGKSQDETARTHQTQTPGNSLASIQNNKTSNDVTSQKILSKTGLQNYNTAIAGAFVLALSGLLLLTRKNKR